LLASSLFFSSLSLNTERNQTSLPFCPQKEQMAATLSVRSNRLSPSGSPFSRPPVHNPSNLNQIKSSLKKDPYFWRGVIVQHRRNLVRAGSRADDSSAPFEMSVESALKLLGVPDGASFDEILRAKKLIVATCKDDQEAIAQVINMSSRTLGYSIFPFLFQ
jgi:hypothetical protein